MIKNTTTIQTVSNQEALTFLQQKTRGNIYKTSKDKKFTTNFNGITQEQLINSNQLMTVVPLADNNDDQNGRIILLRVNDTLKSAVFTMYKDKTFNSSDFSGDIIITTLEDEFVNGYRVKDGILTYQYIKKKAGEKKSKATSKLINSDGIEPVDKTYQLDEVIVFNKFQKSRALYLQSLFTGTDPNYFTESGNNGGSYNDHISWNYGGGKTTDDIAIEDKIDDSELSGKAKYLNDLLNKKGDSFVKKLLANFEGKSEFDIKIVSQEKVFSKDVEVNGRTFYDPSISNVINIQISISRTENYSALENARIILHENLHADITRKLYTINNPPEDQPDFKQTFESYHNQHSAMANLYINSMATALKNFHQNVLVNDYNNYTKYYDEEPSEDFYNAFAWGGLKNSDVKSWIDLTNEQKTAINTLAERATKLSGIVPS